MKLKIGMGLLAAVVIAGLLGAGSYFGAKAQSADDFCFGYAICE